MVLCFVALFVFSILGIFSAYYRRLAKEALLCVLNKSTGKKCSAELDKQIKGKIAGKIGRVSPKLSKAIIRHFTLFSYLFVFLFIASTVYVIYGGVNYYLYGNCYGLESDNFCIFDPTGSNVQTTGLVEDDGTCSLTTLSGQSSLSLLNVSLYQTLDGEGARVYFFGSYACEYTREMYESFRKNVELRNPQITFAMVNTHNTSIFNQAFYCIDNSRVLEYNDLLFNNIDRIYDLENHRYNSEEFYTLLNENGFNSNEIINCIEESQDLISLRLENLKDITLQATPTLYVVDSDMVVMGPRPNRVYSRLLK